jgi:NAD(P) transhydrogenase subunit alpha
MYAKNITTFLLEMIKEGKVAIDMDNEVVRDTLVTRDGQVVHPRVREALDLSPAAG